MNALIGNQNHDFYIQFKGNDDCTDHSDEEHCPAKSCTPGKDFMCKNDTSSPCILATWRCDGEVKYTSEWFVGFRFQTFRQKILLGMHI